MKRRITEKSTEEPAPSEGAAPAGEAEHADAAAAQLPAAAATPAGVQQAEHVVAAAPPAAAAPAGVQQVVAAGAGDAATTAGGAGSVAAISSTTRAVQSGRITELRQAAQEFAQLCQRDPASAVGLAATCTLELAGIPIAVEIGDLMQGTTAFMEALPERIRDSGVDLTVYPLLPSDKKGRRGVSSLERFWTLGIGQQSGVGLLEGGPPDQAGGAAGSVLENIREWLLAMSKAPVRSLRHVSTVAALSIAKSLGQHCQALNRTRDTLQTQLSMPAGKNRRQQAQLEKDARAAAAHSEGMYAARTKLLEGIVPPRSRDVCGEIRLYTLCEVDRLMRQDPEMYIQNRWTARVFLMVHDPNVDVRLKALGVIHQWFASTSHSAAVQEHLAGFATRCLSHLVERTADVDSRVAAAAIRCLRLPTLSEKLEDSEFDRIVNLCVGGRDAEVRQEAALFINAHVFQDPGICNLPSQPKGRRQEDDGDRGDGLDGDREPEPEENADNVRELYNSETSISMLMEFLESYVGDRLRNTERVVNAFWGLAPSLWHWSTMVNLCLVGETKRAGLEPIPPVQRLGLLYIMEAAVRRAEEDLQSTRPAEKDAAVKRFNDACAQIIPEMPRLMEVCRPHSQMFLLLSHVCKTLVEHAVDSAQNQVLVNAPAMCHGLQRAINGQLSMDTVKYCVDALVALARCFDEAKTAFLDLSKNLHHVCSELLAPENVTDRAEDLRIAMARYLILSNRAIDMTFGSPQVLARVCDLLQSRGEWMQQSQAAAEAFQQARKKLQAAKDAAAAKEAAAKEKEAGEEQPAGEEGGDMAVQEEEVPPKPEHPAGVPDARLTLKLLEAALTTVFWHVRIVYWVVEAESAQDGEKAGVAKAEVTDMLQGLGDFGKMKDALPSSIARVRELAAGLVAHDRHPVVRFHAFNLYTSLCQYSVGVSEKVNLEVVEDGEEPMFGPGNTYEVVVPTNHMQALWNYLNDFYDRLTGIDLNVSSFEPEGMRVPAVDIHPAPSKGTMSSARFAVQAAMEAIGKVEGDDEEDVTLTTTQELTFAVLASRAVQESEVEDIYAGPMGMLLVVQCDRSRPKPLREEAFRHLRRFRELARTTEDYAVLYYEFQKKAVGCLFDCAGVEAAQSLCKAFTAQWGPRQLPWLERPFFMVLMDAILGSVAPDLKQLPLLDVWLTWVKGDEFLPHARATELAKRLQQHCTALNIDCQQNEVLARTLRRLQGRDRMPPPAPAAAAAGKVAAVDAAEGGVAQASEAPGQDDAAAAEPAQGQGAEDAADIVEDKQQEADVAASPALAAAPPLGPRRISGKRKVEEATEKFGGTADVSETTEAAARRQKKSDPEDFPIGM
eukprot:TRINITY_DN11424_c0_g1_i8.p1 TRINITY_DN11424_c0_g1~~TRINITY_DN11424_c0_g1_i8.p1  ORF type:complete len:1346 (-),score=342.55 TRINITY_DN11424_c0_g1_i8:43-4080(-)